MTVTETREIALGNDEKWMNSRYTVKVVCIGFSDRLDGWVGKGNRKVFGLCTERTPPFH